MENYTIRVELNGLHTNTDRARLNSEMKKEGFTQLISATEEETLYEFPAPNHNLFDEDDDDTTIRVLDAARRAAAATGKKFSVLVTKGDDKAEWYNDIIRWQW